MSTAKHNGNIIQLEQLPLHVAEKLRFPLQYHINNSYKYSVHDWLGGIALTNRPGRLWNEIKHKSKLDVEKLPYRASNNKIYQMDFADSANLLKITRLTKSYRGISGLQELLEAEITNSDNYVYIIGMKMASGLYKIGITANISKRLAIVTTSNPFKPYYEMNILTNRHLEIEEVIHRELDEKRVSGEWFHLSLDELEAVKKRIVALIG